MLTSELELAGHQRNEGLTRPDTPPSCRPMAGHSLGRPQRRHSDAVLDLLRRIRSRPRAYPRKRPSNAPSSTSATPASSSHVRRLREWSSSRSRPARRPGSPVSMMRTAATRGRPRPATDSWMEARLRGICTLRARRCRSPSTITASDMLAKRLLPAVWASRRDPVAVLRTP